MKNKISKIIISLFIFLISSSGCWMIDGYLIAKDSPPRRPKSDVKVTQDIEWWGDGDDVYRPNITSFEIDPIDGVLNIFNHKKLIQFKIKGQTASSQSTVEPYIKYINVTLNYQFEKVPNKENEESIPFTFTPYEFREEVIQVITVTPVVGYRENKSYKGEAKDFSITAEYIVKTLTAFPFKAENKFVFLCGDFSKSLILEQGK